MKLIYNALLVLSVTIFSIGCSSDATNKETKETEAKSVIAPKSVQSVQVFTVNNADKKITPKSIEAVFDSNGLVIDGNNNMNSPFEQRFNNTHYRVYNLAMFRSDKLTLNLIKKYSGFGALTPLTMSIWSDGDTMNIATLTIEGIARAGQIPLDDPDLIEYSKLIDKVLHLAMPNGKYKTLDFTLKFPNKAFTTDFQVEIELDEDSSITEYKEDFQAELEAELEPLGFLLPNYINMNEEIFIGTDYAEYDFYDTYSICKFDVIYPVSKMHPEAGAYAPCSFYMYKKKDDNIMHMGFLSVDNWITTLDVEDEESIKPLREAQAMIEDIINEMIE